ncbi:MAG: hypothetical protein ACK5Q5_01480 [Planctomycetaceae bacterium]
MSIRFAGSRCVDERRRRRLAQEADGAELPARLAARRRQTASDNKLPRGSSPADSLVSPRLWKHVVVGIACVLAWGAVLLIGSRADAARTGMESIVGISSGKLTTFFSTVMLLAAGQLAFINLWYRSRSRKDFNGSYKLWFWTALSWLAFCAVQASGAHWSLADAVLAGRLVTVWNARAILWMVPTAIAFATLYALLRREMRDCRESLWTLRLTAATVLASGLTMLFGPFFFDPQTQMMADAALGMGWHMLLAYAMLLHTRHVIHVSNEPPQSEVRRFRWLAWLALFRRRGSRGAKPASKGTSSNDNPATSKSRKSTKKKRPTSRRRAAVTSNAAVTEDVESDESDLDINDESDDSAANEDPALDVAASSQAAKAPRVAPAAAPQRRVDPPRPAAQSKPHFATAPPSDEDNETSRNWSESDEDEGSDGQNLSRKDRKRLKKLQRQQTRSSR